MSTLVIALLVVVGAVFYLGFLVGGEVQRHILRGHEGTRAEKLRQLRRELRRERQAHVLRRRRELYGPLLQAVDDPTFGSRLGREDQARWWRRHPGPVRPTQPLPDDPFLDGPSSGAAR